MSLLRPKIEVRVTGWLAILVLAILSADAIRSVAWLVMLAAGWQ